MDHLGSTDGRRKPEIGRLQSISENRQDNRVNGGGVEHPSESPGSPTLRDAAAGDEFGAGDHSELLEGLVGILKNLVAVNSGRGAGSRRGSVASGAGTNAAKHNRRQSEGPQSHPPTAAQNNLVINQKIKNDCVCNGIGEVLRHVGKLHNTEKGLLDEIMQLGDVVGFSCERDDDDEEEEGEDGDRY